MSSHNTGKYSRKQHHFIYVYASGFKTAYKIHPSAVVHLPNVNPATYVLCSFYDTARPNSCRLGDSCKFVHADTTSACEHSVHVNFAWRSVESCTYERFPEGTEMRVTAPNFAVVVDVMDSSFVLKTKVRLDTNKLTHCAHYYFNRTCNLGPDCQFVHAVYVDPFAVRGQRAPVPSQIGDGRVAQPSKCQREAAAVGVAGTTQHTKPSTVPTLHDACAMPKVRPQRFVAVDSDAVPAPHHSVASASSAVAASISSLHACSKKEAAKQPASAVARLPRGPSSSSSSDGYTTHSPHRAYRFDPYSMTQPMQIRA